MNISNRIKSFNKNSFLRSSSLYLFSNIFNGILPLLLLPVFTSYLSPSEYGVVAMFQVVVTGLMSIVGVGYATASDRKYFDGTERLNSYITASIHLVFLSAFVVFCIVYFSFDYLIIVLGFEPKILLFSVLVAFCSVITQIRLGQWQVRHQSKCYVLFQVFFALLINVVALYLVVGVMMGANGRIYALIFSYVFFACISLLSLYKSKLFGFNIPALSDYKEMLDFCIPIIPHLIGVFFLTVFDRYIIKLNLGMASVGIYMVGFQLMSCVGLFADAVNKVFSPLQMKMLEKEGTEERLKIVKLIYMWLLALVFIAILSSIFFYFAIDFLLPPRYFEAKKILFFIAIGHAFNGVYLVILNNIYYSKKTKFLLLPTLIISFIHLLVFYFFTAHYGVVGASFSFSLSMFFRLVFTFYFANRAMPLPWLLR
ncbi:lipopolysaccharide biosynthesis protein [Marinomonas arenicola]|uniref:Oligosaccharide flippase family protein n=1 Tax=Marinomonas arenicola TaxID=569601 RepID=A0ABU9G5N7_9GAMM